MFTPYLALLLGFSILTAIIAPGVALGLEGLLAPMLGQAIAGWITWVAANGGLIALGPLLIQAAKKSRLVPFLDDYTDIANRVWSGLFAVASTVGIAYFYDPALNGGTFTITGVSPLGIATFILEAATRFGGQELLYRYVIKGGSRR